MSNFYNLLVSSFAHNTFAFTFLQLGQLDRASAACARAAELPDPTGETARLTELIAASK